MTTTSRPANDHRGVGQYARPRRRPLAVAAFGLATTGLVAAVLPAAPAAAQDAAEQIVNGSFDDGLEGWTAFPDGFVDDDGFGCITVPAGTDAYAALIGQNVPITAGETYELSFTAKLVGEGRPNALRTVVQLDVDPFTQVLPEVAIAGDLSTEPTDFSFTFTAEDDIDPALAGIAQQTAANDEAYTVCVDDVSLLGGQEREDYEPDTGPRVRVNQVGYHASGPKGATLVTDATAPVPWSLVDGDGGEVASGTTAVHGTDPTAGLDVHTIDFSGVTSEGDGFTLEADGETSHPFAIGVDDVYDQLRTDALDYYYPARAGIEIRDTDELAPTDIGGDSYARAAGHLGSPLPEGDPDRDPRAVSPDETANTGDFDVPCQSEDNQTFDGEPVYAEGYWTCPDGYRLDVQGGWYDAGDHGKYVVNGGISVAQLMGIWERTLGSDADVTDGALADGTLAIPEAGNDVPDVLDEARWQLEFLLRMQVPEGTPDFGISPSESRDLSGMAHHKIHDEGWTGLPLMPADDPQIRSLHRPSTAATLNLAAVAAQGARLFAPYDEAFADELLAAAERAWDASVANPQLYATPEDGNAGGGPYDDTDVRDERYWAAAELFLTTGEDRYRYAVEASPFHLGGDEEAFDPGGPFWGDLASLARMQLATVDGVSEIDGRDDIRASVVSAGRAYAEVQDAQPFGNAYAGTDGEFVWGSNSAVLNTMVVMATAYDLSGDVALRAAVAESMDYLLGRNALGWSYLTGYGADGYTSVNQHSRWWADAIDESSPNPPPGVISGGPNSTDETWDPVIRGLYPEANCAPQRCYVDDIQSWSTNELTINWNAPMAWVASFLADNDELEAPAAGRLAGSDRVGTALAVSGASFADAGGAGEQAGAVVLATGRDFPDVLAGTPLAAAVDAPILLTDTATLDGRVLTELRRVLAPGGTVHLLGGTAALSADVEQAVVDAGYEVDRIAGADRYATALAVADRLADLDLADVALVTTGEQFPDALSAGTAAAANGGVVLLTPSGTANAGVDAWLAEHTPEAVAVGGPAAEAYATLDAVVGSTRHETAALVAERWFAEATFAGIARSDAFPDAVVGGLHAARNDGPVLLTPRDALHPAAEARLCAAGAERAFAYGGTAALDDDVRRAVADVIGGDGC